MTNNRNITELAKELHKIAKNNPDVVSAFWGWKVEKVCAAFPANEEKLRKITEANRGIMSPTARSLPLSGPNHIQ